MWQVVRRAINGRLSVSTTLPRSPVSKHGTSVVSKAEQDVEDISPPVLYNNTHLLQPPYYWYGDSKSANMLSIVVLYILENNLI